MVLIRSTDFTIIDITFSNVSDFAHKASLIYHTMGYFNCITIDIPLSKKILVCVCANINGKTWQVIKRNKPIASEDGMSD